MESDKSQKSGVIRNAKGEGCVAIEQTDDGILHYFQNEADIDRLLDRMIAYGVHAEDERGRLREIYLKSDCHRHTAGFCTGSCTSNYARCGEHVTLQFTSCYCS